MNLGHVLLPPAALAGLIAVTHATAASAQRTHRAERGWAGAVDGRYGMVEPPFGPVVRVTAGPAAVTSETRRASAPMPDWSYDLRWADDLELPDLPVRWDAQVIRYLEYYRENPRGRSHLRGWMRRLGRYRASIEAQLAALGLPRDLVFVAMVESGFDPRARSGAGAQGLWQLVRGTAEDLGLRVDTWVDERLDPERSTAAAGRYLQRLHARFGTWELALAAYNMGHGALRRAIQKYNTNDYWALRQLEAGLPYETSLYVPKIMACALAAHNPGRFGLATLRAATSTASKSIDVPGGTALRTVARLAGVDRAVVLDLNPALRRERTPPGRETWPVRLPAERIEAFAARWARRTPSRPLALPRRLGPGQDLSDLARIWGTKPAAIRRANGLDADERVPAGTRLLVPVTDRRQARARQAAETPVAVPLFPTSLAGRRRVFHRVAPHDRLAEVARFYEVRVDDLLAWNRLDPAAALQPGMMLQLFVRPQLDVTRATVLTPEECRVLTVGSDAFFDHHEAQAGRVRFRYRARAGDTLATIARRFGIGAASLARINRVSRRKELREGDAIIVYAEASRVPPRMRAAPDG